MMKLTALCVVIAMLAMIALPALRHRLRASWFSPLDGTMERLRLTSTLAATTLTETQLLEGTHRCRFCPQQHKCAQSLRKAWGWQLPADCPNLRLLTAIERQPNALASHKPPLCVGKVMVDALLRK